MVLLKLKFFKSCNSLILLLISLLGFTTACEKENDRYEYGAPPTNYVVIKGKVNSVGESKPVPEIIVKVSEVVTTLGTEEIQLKRTGFSDSQGDYWIPLSEDKTYQLKFIDTDGALNGEYETLDTTVVTNDIEFPKESTGTDGVPEKVMNIQLKPKK